MSQIPINRNPAQLERTAIMAGVNSKIYRHRSRSKSTQVGMTNDWLQAQGLDSFRGLWMKAHGNA